MFELENMYKLGISLVEEYYDYEKGGASKGVTINKFHSSECFFDYCHILLMRNLAAFSSMLF